MREELDQQVLTLNILLISLPATWKIKLKTTTGVIMSL